MKRNYTHYVYLFFMVILLVIIVVRKELRSDIYDINLGDVVQGDIDGSGEPGSTDLILIKKDLLDEKKLTGDEKSRAENLDGKSEIKSGDLMVLKKILLGETSTVEVTGISLDKKNITLIVGNIETLTATINPDSATNKNVTYASSNKKVATIDDNGKVTAVANGTATITVTTKDGSKKATCKVIVHKEPKIHFIRQKAPNSPSTLANGDAILLESNGHYAMIDTGLNYEFDNKFIVDYLKRVGVTKLDFILLTHNHRDHIGGAAYIMKNIKVDKFIYKTYLGKDGSAVSATKRLNEVLEVIKNKKIEVVYIDKYFNDGDSIYLEDMRIRLYNVKQNTNEVVHCDENGKHCSKVISENSNSVIELITVNEYKILLTADLYDEEENIKYFTTLSYDKDFKNLDLFKMPHHGSERSVLGNKNDGTYNIEAFNNFNPNYIVVTGSYNHCVMCRNIGVDNSKTFYAHYKSYYGVIATFINKDGKKAMKPEYIKPN